MAESKKKKVEGEGRMSFLSNPTFQSAAGILLLLFGFLLLMSCVSGVFYWHADQSEMNYSLWEILKLDKSPFKNWGGRVGAFLSHWMLFKWFGLASIGYAYLVLMSGVKILFKPEWLSLKRQFWNVLIASVVLSALLGYFIPSYAIGGGGIGASIRHFVAHTAGPIGGGILVIGLSLLYVVVIFKIEPADFQRWFKRKEKTNLPADIDNGIEPESDPEAPEIDFFDEEEEVEEEIFIDEPLDEPEEIELSPVAESPADEVEISIEQTEEEKLLTKVINEKVQEFGLYDPRLELSGFKFPPLEMLNDYGQSNITVNQEELEANKNRIVETLSHYNIKISKIKATIGPTVTLYEIVPAAGVRISKIKNLEDDIALSLAALGIRIIAPMPGKGTIGIEVPNAKKNIVSMRSVIASEKFQKSDMELPLALGRTISNETFVVDLAKMPHLLMAGATGQGKSVGLNAILTSLLYKKHPAEVKFVLVDPKKVELTLFNKIERHYLAKLPNEGEAIITDTKKVINTLNSLCMEMDDRYEILKEAHCRNIVEYNKKFSERRLNPEKGHRFLPYIVLVIDEFADLIMTAGKEVETPIARLAQLARAIGIHLIIATQRPSVNVITGVIKANFPSRIAFRVTSKIDSRTILDSGGADQLIGKGDMLYSSGNEPTRLQCALVDTPEVEKITEFIGDQRAYVSAYLLPEYVGEEGGGNTIMDLDDRDSMFEEAARVVVMNQQGSASLLQRKLKLGYNRAGRIVDQLEAAGIIGPFEGSKARQVLIQDELSLEQLLKNLDQNNL
jgi:S-DNA-T family DNA segregation ATPase FtsK/SpoIIIE